jgi:hypothetical protein
VLLRAAFVSRVASAIQARFQTTIQLFIQAIKVAEIITQTEAVTTITHKMVAIIHSNNHTMEINMVMDVKSTPRVDLINFFATKRLSKQTRKNQNKHAGKPQHVN